MKRKERSLVQNVMEHKMLAANIGIGILLAVLGLMDIKTKRVPLGLLGALLGAGVFFAWMHEGDLFRPLVSAAVMGFSMGGIVWLSKRSVGEGDAWALAGLAGYLGVFETITVLFYSLLVCAGVCGVWMARKRKSLKSQIPFLPFLCLGYGIHIWLFRGGLV